MGKEKSKAKKSRSEPGQRIDQLTPDDQMDLRRAEIRDVMIVAFATALQDENLGDSAVKEFRRSTEDLKMAGYELDDEFTAHYENTIRSTARSLAGFMLDYFSDDENFGEMFSPMASQAFAVAHQRSALRKLDNPSTD